MGTGGLFRQAGLYPAAEGARSTSLPQGNVAGARFIDLIAARAALHNFRQLAPQGRQNGGLAILSQMIGIAAKAGKSL